MKDKEIAEAPSCPSCGAPRLVHAWDCAKCGAVFDGEKGPRQTEDGVGESADSAPDSAAPRRQGSARRSSSARRPGAAPRTEPARSTGGGLIALREWVADNIAVAVILSFIFYVAVVWLFGAVIVGATDSPGAVKSTYREVTGRPLPVGFGPTLAAHFVSRRLVVLDRPDQVFLVLYKDEDGSTDGDLLAFAEGALDLFEVPWERIRTRNATVGGEAIEVSVLRIFGEGGPHLYLVPTSTTDGERALEAVLGAPEDVLEVVEEMVRSR